MRTLNTALLAILAMLLPATGFTVVDPADVEKGDTVLLTIEDQRRFVQPLNLFGVFQGLNPSSGTYTIEFRMRWNPEEANNAWFEDHPSLDRRGDPLTVPLGMGDLRQVSREEADALVEEMNEAVPRARRVWKTGSGTFDEVFEKARKRAEALESLELDHNADLLRLYSDQMWVRNTLWAAHDDTLEEKRQKLARTRSDAVVERIRSTLRETEALDPVREVLVPHIHYENWNIKWINNPWGPENLAGRYLHAYEKPPIRVTERQRFAIDLLRSVTIRALSGFYYTGDNSHEPSDAEAREEARKTFAAYLGLITDGGAVLPEGKSLEDLVEQMAEQEKKKY